MRLLVATRSPGKTREIRELLADAALQVSFPDDLGLERLPEEDDLEQTDSYVGNAVAKARYFAQRSGLPTVADDSGLEVDALGGVPGVHSARFALEQGRVAPGQSLDDANNALLLARMVDVPPEQRTARYRCVVAYLAGPGDMPEIVEATCEGSILPERRGTNGFGYDPLFFSEDLQRGFGEVPTAVKHDVSHRGRAFRALLEVLQRRPVS